MQTPTAIAPYLEDSISRVFEENDLEDTLELTCGTTADRLNVDADGVTVSSFTSFADGTPDDRGEHIRQINQHKAEASDDVELVWNRQEALEKGTHAVWVMTDGEAVTYPHPFADSDTDTGDSIRLPSDVYVYERIPFTHPVETREDLENALENTLSPLHPESNTVEITLS